MSTGAVAFKFRDAKEAAEFLAGKVIAEARRQGVPLTEAERRVMLYSPSHPESSAGMDEILNTDDDTYDDKITTLLKSAYEHDGDMLGEQAKYQVADDLLNESDLYISFLADDALNPAPPPATLKSTVAMVLGVLFAFLTIVVIVLRFITVFRK